MDRISRISQINSKYRGSRVSPGHVVVTGGLPIATAPVGGVTTIRRSRIGTSPIGGGVVHYGGVIGGASAVRTSRIVTPAVYGAVNNAPVYEVITTPPKVYEIRTPIIQVTPDTVTQTNTVTNVNQGGANARIWAKKDRQTSGCCKWWCWVLLCLLLLGLLGGLLFFFKDKIFGTKTNNETHIENVNTAATAGVNNTQTQQSNQLQTNTQTETTSSQNTAENSNQNSNTNENADSTVKANENSNQNSNSNSNQNSGSSSQTKTQTSTETQQVAAPKTPYCEDGSFLHNGRCLKCPGDSTWNGSQCIRKVVTTRKIVEYKTEGESDGGKSSKAQEQSNGSSSSTNSSSSSSFSNSSSNSNHNE